MPFKILVVDDEEGLVTLMETNLEIAGYAVVTAGDGEQAIEVARREKPDLIILDIRMPKKTGWDVCQELKSKEDTRNIPIIFLSAYAQRDDMTKGLSMGAEKYMTKPADPLEVVRTIELILEKKHAEGKNNA